jgi:hypothetical protein
MDDAAMAMGMVGRKHAADHAYLLGGDLPGAIQFACVLGFRPGH